MQIDLTTRWNYLLDRFPKNRYDVYFMEEYVGLYDNDTERATCFVYQDGEKMMLFPFLSRSFEFQGNTYKDFETAYGYGGPVCNSSDKEFLGVAWQTFRRYCQEKGYVAGFVRFHPLMNNYEGFESIGELMVDRNTVVINLDQTTEEVWKNEIHTKNRNVIRKAEKCGCTFVVDDDFHYLEDFERLYYQTMDKLSASSFYYFPESYYDNLRKGVTNSFLGCVKDAEGQVISAAIFMYSDNYGHYHLSGSDKQKLALSPNNLMLWGAACELQRRGVKLFHLGGGTNGDENNPLYLFKRRFSRETCQFHLGKLIFNQEAYDNLCSDWEKRNPEQVASKKHFLLKYKY